MVLNRLCGLKQTICLKKLMKAKQSFNGSGVKADADKIQHVLIRPVVKAMNLSYLPPVKMRTTNGVCNISLPFKLLPS